MRLAKKLCGAITVLVAITTVVVYIFSVTTKLNETSIFCDGACTGNPGPGGWGSIVCDLSAQITELGGGDPATTNNRMEMTAVLMALKHVSAEKNTAENNKQIKIYTDSTYVIRGVTQWSFGWQRRGWTTSEGEPVANKDIWQELLAVVRRFEKGRLEWHYVRGHTGVEGNERCDEIAVCYANGRFTELYRGPLIKYGVPIFDLPEDTSLPEMKPKTEKATPYSYLSLVGGIAYVHANWAECERRVKGQSGAKFKKALNADDEKAILSSWGVDPSQAKRGSKD